MYGLLDVSTSGMIAQRVRMTAISGNIANNNSWVRTATGELEPYRRRSVEFAAGNPGAATAAGRAVGVHVARIEVDQGEFNLRWDPTSSFAYKSGPKRGYVPESNINSVVEQINAMEASRAYEANVVAAESSKQMIGQALRLLA